MIDKDELVEGIRVRWIANKKEYTFNGYISQGVTIVDDKNWHQYKKLSTFLSKFEIVR